MTGAYLTEDAGASWRMFNLRTTTDFFVFDPVDPQVIYDYGLGLWRTADPDHPDSSRHRHEWTTLWRSN